MLAILCDLGLDQYITKGSAPPEEKEVHDKWKSGDAKACTQIELAIGDSEMVYIQGAETASEMWEQLATVKESRGTISLLAA